MVNYYNHLIYNNLTIKKALEKLNSLRDENLTLFVVSEENKMLGTLTDGDIRRAILTGATLNSPIAEFIFTDFVFIEQNNIDTRKIQFARKKGIELLPLLNKAKQIKKIYNLKETKSVITP